MTVILLLVAIATFVAAALTFLASVTDWFKREIPVEFGFLFNDSIVNKLDLSSGDAAKPISLRFCNTGRTTLAGLVFNMEFMEPISLSGTDKTLTLVPGKTVHGRIPDQNYYLIRYEDIMLLGQRQLDFRVELNTKDKSPGIFQVFVTVYSTQSHHKFKKAELSIHMS